MDRPRTQRDSRAAQSRTILVVGEGTTLAHVGRPLVVAKALADAGYEVIFACDKRFLPFVDINAMPYVPVTSIGGEQFLKRLAWGRPLFTLKELTAAIQEDLRLLDEVRPMLVIGDMRWSLAVSARLKHIPYAAISNAQWSLYAIHQDWILPAHPVTQHFGFSGMQLMFRLSKPLVFALLALPSNRVRRQYGLPLIGCDMRRINEDADFVLFPDMPTLHPTRDLPETHHYVGPIHWSPAVALPKWWSELRADLPIVYVNLGSSGSVELLPMILATLTALPLQIIAATAGRTRAESPAPNVFLADYLPGDVCMQRAVLAITNGGSMTGYQALACATPVLGIVSHLDQSLSMKPIADAGAGVLLCSPYVTPEILLTTVNRMLGDPSFKYHARRLQQSRGGAFDAASLIKFIETLVIVHDSHS